MDQYRMDTLTRFVARRTGRRSIAAGLFSGFLATVIPGLGEPIAGAKRQARKPRCKKPKRRCGKRCVDVTTSRHHCGKCDRKCKKHHICTRGRCVRACGKGGPCRVFVTSTSYEGNFGGLAAADAICNRRARAAKLPGTYKAWLSTADGSPSSRFARSRGPYVLPTGTRIANSWADLTDGTLMARIDVTEHGRPPSEAAVWTATSHLGEWLPGGDCSNWTAAGSAAGRVGLTTATTDQWTNFSVIPCENTQAFYCFQQS